MNDIASIRKMRSWPEALCLRAGAGELADAGAPTESGFEDCFRGGKGTV